MAADNIRTDICTHGQPFKTEQPQRRVEKRKLLRYPVGFLRSLIHVVLHFLRGLGVLGQHLRRSEFEIHLADRAGEGEWHLVVGVANHSIAHTIPAGLT